jgi:hypothetical protein
MERPHAGRLVSFVQHLEEIPSYQWFKGHRPRQHHRGALGGYLWAGPQGDGYWTARYPILENGAVE